MADIKKVLTKMLAELEDDDKNELLDELKNRKLTGAELVEAIKSLPPESRAEVRAALAEAKEEIENEEKDGKRTKETKTEDTKDEKNKKDEKRRTRPGRKSGRAYGWWIDEEGEVIKLDIARVYSGEDEPDEVDLLPKQDDDDDEDENDEENAA